VTQTSRLSAGNRAGRLFRVLKTPSDLDPRDLPLTPSNTDCGHFYRHGEVVWLILSKPVMLDYADGAVDGFIIRFWPSIIETGEDYENPSAVPRGHGTDSATPLKVRLFSSGIAYHVPQCHILPFWAYSPDELWLQNLRLQTHRPLSHIQDPFTGFIRVFGSPSGEETTFNTGHLLSHFLFDVETSLEVGRSWSAAPRTTTRTQSGGEPVLIRSRPLTMPALCGELWWGAERIMLGDLIRLRVPESKLHKLDTDQIRIIPRSFHELPTEGTPADNPESEDGQLFFRLRSLAVIKGENGRGLHGFGGLYRLVPVGPGLLPPVAADADHRHTVLPRPPEGFTFQPILQSGWEIELSLHYIDGRYYPRIHELTTEASGVDAHVFEVLEGVVRWRAPPLRPLYFRKGSRKETIARVTGLEQKPNGDRSTRC